MSYWDACIAYALLWKFLQFYGVNSSLCNRSRPRSKTEAELSVSNLENAVLLHFASNAGVRISPQYLLCFGGFDWHCWKKRSCIYFDFLTRSAAAKETCIASKSLYSYIIRGEAGSLFRISARQLIFCESASVMRARVVSCYAESMLSQVECPRERKADNGFCHTRHRRNTFGIMLKQKWRFFFVGNSYVW